MASPTSIDTFIVAYTDFNETLGRILAFNGVHLKSNKESSILFTQIMGRLEIIKNSINEIDDSLLQAIIVNIIQTTSHLQLFTISSSRRDNVKSETLTSGDFQSAYDIVRQFSQYINSIWPQIFSENPKERYDSIIKKLENDRILLKTEIENLVSKSEQDAITIHELKYRMENELENFEERYKKNLGNYELIAQEKIFREEADDNNKGTAFWIRVIIGLTIVLLVICIWFMYSCWLDFTCLFTKYSIGNFYQSNKWQALFYYELFKPVLIRLFILSIIVLLIKFSIRNYNALMHNKTVNMHKANSLAAMIRIINSLQNEETRNTLINLAGKEIFLHQKTGYLRKDDTKIDLNVLEKLLSLLQKKE